MRWKLVDRKNLETRNKTEDINTNNTMQKLSLELNRNKTRLTQNILA